MAITRDRLGRFASSGGGGKAGSRPESKRQGFMRGSGGKGAMGNRLATKQTLGERMKTRLQKQQSNQITRVMGDYSNKSIKKGERIMAAQNRGRKS